MSDAPDKYPEALVLMRDDLTGLLAAQGVEPGPAREIAAAAVENLRQNHGGMYLPKGYAAGLSIRDREIGKKWNGRNKAQLCREYDLTEQRLYQILARLRAEQVAARQLRMF